MTTVRAPEEAETVMAETKMLYGILERCMMYNYPAGRIIFDIASHAARHDLDPNTAVKIIAPVLNSRRPIKPKTVLTTSTLNNQAARPKVHVVLCDLYNDHPDYFDSDPTTTTPEPEPEPKTRPELQIHFIEDKEGNLTDKVDMEPTYDDFTAHFKTKATHKGGKIELRYNRDWNNLYHKIKIGESK